MMKTVKKKSDFLLSMIVLVLAVMLPISTKKVQAATELKANITYSESICHETKVYNFTMPSSGYFS